jgi:hypothetical protein
MSALGLSYPTRKFAKTILDTSGGSRLSAKNLAALDLLVGGLNALVSPIAFKTAFKFLYPFVGGSAVTNSFNLADPSVGRITWSGTVTHNANGITGDGTSGHGDTNVVLSGTDAYLVAMGVYSRTESTRDSYELCNGLPGTNGATAIAVRRATDSQTCVWNGSFYDGSHTIPFLAMSVTPATSVGLFSLLRVNTGTIYCFIGHLGTTSTVGSSASTAINSFNASNFRLLSDSSGGNRSNRNLAFAYLTDPTVTGLTSARMATL